MKKILIYLKGVYYSPRHLLLHVLFLLTIGFLYLERDHEDALYYNIIRVTRQEKAITALPDTAYIKRLMRTIHTMMYNRSVVFQNTEQLSIKNRIFHSVDEDLMYGHGACGGFSKVLSRSLQLSGYKVRIGQMKVNGVYGGHIIVEVFLTDKGRWAVIDPLFLLTFPSADGGWAGFAEIKERWAAYSPLLPADYNPAYKYEAVRYANWEKIPVAGKLIFKGLQLVMGKDDANSLSIRPYLLNMYAAWLQLMVAVYAVFCVLSYRRLSKKGKQVPR